MTSLVLTTLAHGWSSTVKQTASVFVFGALPTKLAVPLGRMWDMTSLDSKKRQVLLQWFLSLQQICLC